MPKKTTLALGSHATSIYSIQYQDSPSKIALFEEHRSKVGANQRRSRFTLLVLCVCAFAATICTTPTPASSWSNSPSRVSVRAAKSASFRESSYTPPAGGEGAAIAQVTTGNKKTQQWGKTNSAQGGREQRRDHAIAVACARQPRYDNLQFSYV